MQKKTGDRIRKKMFSNKKGKISTIQYFRIQRVTRECLSTVVGDYISTMKTTFYLRYCDPYTERTC